MKSHIADIAEGIVLVFYTLCILILAMPMIIWEFLCQIVPFLLGKYHERK